MVTRAAIGFHPGFQYVKLNVVKQKFITEDYYMATIVHALWLAAERALFSCNDRAL